MVSLDPSSRVILRGVRSADLSRPPRGRLSRHAPYRGRQAAPRLDRRSNPAVPVLAVQAPATSCCLCCGPSFRDRHGPRTPRPLSREARARKREVRDLTSDQDKHSTPLKPARTFARTPRQTSFPTPSTPGALRRPPRARAGDGRGAAGSSGGVERRARRRYGEVISAWQWVLIAFGVTVALYALFIAVLLLAGRRTDAQARATFIPDCLVLFQALVRDPRAQPVARCCSWS